jgi:hypothetical protein
MELAFAKMLHRLSIDSKTSAIKYHELTLPQGGPVGTNHGNNKAEEDGEYEREFVAKSERYFPISAPLEVGRDAENDNEGSVEECLECEAD